MNGGARPGSGRPEGGPAGRSAATYRPPLSRDRMAEVAEYAELHGLKIARAVDLLLDRGLREARASDALSVKPPTGLEGVEHRSMVVLSGTPAGLRVRKNRAGSPWATFELVQTGGMRTLVEVAPQMFPAVAGVLDHGGPITVRGSVALAGHDPRVLAKFVRPTVGEAALAEEYAAEHGEGSG